jgi:hypothetical protein
VSGEKDIEAVLQRLDELTHDDPLTAATQTLEVIYRLMENMSVVMDGEETSFVFEICRRGLLNSPTSRGKGLR